MKLTGCVCPSCGQKTDSSPCWRCGYNFPDFQQEGENKKGAKTTENQELRERVKSTVKDLGFDTTDLYTRRARDGVYMSRSGLHRAWANAGQMESKICLYLESAHRYTTAAMNELKAFARELKRQKKEQSR